MTKSTKSPRVDAFLSRTQKWREEIDTLRSLALGFPLVEDLKWGKPCYSFQESNILIIQPFKEYIALMFCKGALLKDPKKILVAPGQNTQAARQARFTSAQEITKLRSVLKAYINEAIEAQKAGLEVKYKTVEEFPVPDELKNKFRENPALKIAFKALTPGRQKGYLLHFSGAKLSKTREARIEKCAKLIFSGKGLLD